MATAIHDDFADMLAALAEAGAEYTVVGAYALAAHGIPRATGDIDTFVLEDAEALEKLRD